MTVFRVQEGYGTVQFRAAGVRVRGKHVFPSIINCFLRNCYPVQYSFFREQALILL